MPNLAFSWGYPIFIFFSYNRRKITYIHYKHQIQFYFFGRHIFTAILHSYTDGIIFIKTREIPPEPEE